MAEIDVNMTLRGYDQFCPLLLGDVPTPGVRLRIDHRTSMVMSLPEELDLAEVSFNRYAMCRARGDDSLIGLPSFILRGFRHRNFFVRRDSSLSALSDLKGLRVGTNSWSDTGTMWARAAMRDAGVGVEDVSWVIGKLDANTLSRPAATSDARPPRHARYLNDGESLLAELAADRIDAVTTAFAPEDVFKAGGTIRRLVANYRAVEADYHRRTGIYPGFHIIAARRDFAEKHPAVVLSVYEALRQSFEMWMAKVKKFAEASPWAMDELEVLLRDFADDTPPFGMQSPSHRRMVAAACEEQQAQGLVEKAALPEMLFADFADLRQRLGHAPA